MVIQARSCDFAQLFCLRVRQLTIFQRTFSHVLPHHDHASVFARGFSHPSNFSVAPAGIRDSNILRTPYNNSFVRLAFTECTLSTHGQEMMLVLQDPPVSSSFSTLDSYATFFHSFPYHPRIPIRIILVFDEQNRLSQLGTFSHPCHNVLKLCFPQEACMWVSVQISPKKNHWIFRTGP